MNENFNQKLTNSRNFILGPSWHPLYTSLCLLVLMGSLSAWVNGLNWVRFIFLLGLICLFLILYKWYVQIISESKRGGYNQIIDRSYRWSISWLIFSEVIFFLVLFSTLFYLRFSNTNSNIFSINKLLWLHFSTKWPNNGPFNLVPEFCPSTAFPLPTINTLILLISGITLTISHNAFKSNHRCRSVIWLIVTVKLGLIFLFCQGYEYFNAYYELNLHLNSGSYGSIFFLLTGFHGLHVIIGLLMLSIIAIRIMYNHFHPQQHFAFEGTIWYWHFVDVIWIILYVSLYII